MGQRGRPAPQFSIDRSAGRSFHFTPRQSDILSLTCDGLSGKQIAAELGISLSTVETQFERLFTKNGFHNRPAAAAAWQRIQTDRANAPAVGGG